MYVIPLFNLLVLDKPEKEMFSQSKSIVRLNHQQQWPLITLIKMFKRFNSFKQRKMK
jgi:hypothetical protein